MGDRRIPDGWKECKLGEVAEINRNSIDNEYSQNKILYLDTSSITRGKVDCYQELLLSDAPSRAKRLVKDKDIIYSTVRPIQRHYGIIKNPPQNLVVSTGFAVIEINQKKADSFFIYYFLTSDEIVEYLDIIAEASTSAYPSLRPADIESLDILLPPLSEQRAIASVLSSLDDKIDLLNRENQTLEHMAEAIFRQWFIEEADEKWEECILNDLCIQIASGGTPSTKIEAYYNGDINWYSTKELNDNFLYESENKITKTGLNNSSAKLFPAGTVVIAIYAAPTVGRLGILANEASFNQAACGLIANEKLCCSEFIYLYLKNQRNELNSMASGSAQQNLNVGKIKSYPTFKVPKNLMDKFKEVIQPIFEKIKLNRFQIRTLEKLRDTLLPKLMSGEVRVKFTDFEVQK